MKIFISYASDDHDIAEKISHSIRSRGHQVFLDKSNLSAGEGYEEKIEEFINKSDLVVFLISPHSISDGRFTLTELKLSQEKWPSAKNNILPVIIKPTLIKDIPNYLSSIVMLEPKGNIPAEVATNVENILKSKKRKYIKFIIPVFVATVLYFFPWDKVMPQNPKIMIEATQPLAFEKRFFNQSDIYNIIIDIKNIGNIEVELVNILIETKSNEGINIEKTGETIEDSLPKVLYQSSKFKGYLLVRDIENINEYRVCAEFSKIKRLCSDFIKSDPTDDFLYNDHFKIPENISQNINAIAWDGMNYLVATSEPSIIYRINEEGQIIDENSFDRLIKVISVGAHGIYIGLEGPNQLAKLSFETLALETTTPILVDTKLEASFGDTISTIPFSMAQDENNVWLLTKGGAGSNGLYYLNKMSNTLTFPHYFEEVSFDLSDLILRNGARNVWSGDNDTSPASIYAFNNEEYLIFGGHDYELAECATDIIELNAKLYIPNCSDWIEKAKVVDKKLHSIKKVDSLLGFSNPLHTFSTTIMKSTPDSKLLVAVNTNMDRYSDTNEYETLINAINWKNGSKIKLEINNARVIDFVPGNESMLVLIESNKGERQLVALTL